MYSLNIFSFAFYLDRYNKSYGKEKLQIKFKNNVYRGFLVFSFIRCIIAYVYCVTTLPTDLWERLDPYVYMVVTETYKKDSYIVVSTLSILIYAMVIHNFCYHKISGYCRPLFGVFRRFHIVLKRYKIKYKTWGIIHYSKLKCQE